jgi:hypothetical protein
MSRIRGSALALVSFVLSTAALSFLYGAAVMHFRVFPYDLMKSARDGYNELRARLEGWNEYSRQDANADRQPVRRLAEAQDGVNLITRVAAGGQLSVLIADMEGRPINEWLIDWFTLWPDATHVPARYKPVSRPGTHIHGAVVMPNGDLVFNFENQGLVRLDPAGRVVWRLAYLTHHSVFLSDDEHLWVSGLREHEAPDPRFPARAVPFNEYTALEVSPDGKVLREWSIEDLLVKNGHGGLFEVSARPDSSRAGNEYPLHLNDVEPFPASMTPGFFGPGDVVVSLRNINTVFVFNTGTEKIKFMSTGRFGAQHDPDFMDGNRISVFDNLGVLPGASPRQSRILILTAPEGTIEVAYEGTAEHPFFTNIMGKSQWLANGNLLITESRRGRAFEVNQKGETVWEYLNPVGNGMIGIVEEVTRLPLSYARLYSQGN